MKRIKHFLTSPLLGMATLGMTLTACGGTNDEGTGSLTVLIEAEETITDGIAAGDDVEEIRDGWTVSFDKYLATVGHVDLHYSTDEDLQAEAEKVYVLDLTSVPSGGLDLWHFDELRAGRWEFNYGTPGAAHGAERHERVDEDDFDEMVDQDWTYLIEGVLMKEDGESCPPHDLVDAGDKRPNGNESGDNECYDAPTVKFAFGVAAETTYGPCQVDDVPGLSVPSGGTQTVAATIHGDHIFFNGFPEGDEGGVARQAQWLADCDLNLDGEVTAEELEAITPAQLPTMADYQFGGAPVEPTNLYEYVRAQLLTQGHFQGEGECAPPGGELHDHDH